MFESHVFGSERTILVQYDILRSITFATPVEDDPQCYLCSRGQMDRRHLNKNPLDLHFINFKKNICSSLFHRKPSILGHFITVPFQFLSLFMFSYNISVKKNYRFKNCQTKSIPISNQPNTALMVYWILTKNVP